jgi:hypothetical protein
MSETKQKQIQDFINTATYLCRLLGWTLGKNDTMINYEDGKTHQMTLTRFVDVVAELQPGMDIGDRQIIVNKMRQQQTTI